MDQKNTTLLKHLDIQEDNFEVKVRIISLWYQPMFTNPEQIYSIEMVVMDEEGTKIHANVLQKSVPKFKNLLQEGAAICIKNPTIARHSSKYKLIDNTNKLTLYYKTLVSHCLDFNGSLFGFSFVKYQNVISKIIPQDTAVDVIGEVVACQTMVNSVGDKGKTKKRIQFDIQDLEGLKLHVTLWDAFAEKFNEYVSNHKDEGIVVVVIQFAMVKFYREKPSLSNAFNGTRLFINSEIDEIKDFRNSMLALRGESKSSQQLTMVSGLSYSYREDFLHNNSKTNIAEISDTVEAKSLIILGTVKAFSKNIPWFYIGCKRCSRKVRSTYIVKDKNDGSGMVEETQIFECDSVKCKGQDIEVLPKFKIPLRVQDDTGIVSLTLFDREANRVFNKPAIELYEKLKENGDLEMFPEDLNGLLDRKFAIKIDVNDYNIKNNCFVYGISKITDDENILNELEMRFSAQRPAESDSVNILSTDFVSVEKFKDAVSCTGENATPTNVDKSTADSPVSHEKAYEKRICDGVNLKREFDEVDKVDDAIEGSATKSRKTGFPIEKDEVVTNLMIPKLDN